MQPAEKPSLCERLGGGYSIASVVDDFVDRVIVDARLNADAMVDEAHHRVPPAGFKFLVTELVCQVYRGPAKVHGPVDGGFACPLEDYRPGVGSVSGRCSAHAG